MAQDINNTVGSITDQARDIMASASSGNFVTRIMNMNLFDKVSVVPLDVHNVIDYIAGATLVATPFMAGFSHIPVARNLFIGGGLNTISYSLITDYRYSVANKLPLPVHMGLDVASGLLVSSAPYLFGYSNRLSGFQKAVHWVLGMGVVALVAMTKSRNNTSSIVREMIPQGNAIDMPSAVAA